MRNRTKDTIPQAYKPEEHDPIIRKLILTIIDREDGSLKQRNTFNKLLFYFYVYPKLPKLYVEHNLKIEDYEDAYNRATSILAGINLNKEGLTKSSCRSTNSRKICEFAKKNDLNDDPKIIRERFVGFFKEILNKRILDIYREKEREKPSKSLDAPISGESTSTYLDNIADLTISGLEELIEEEKIKDNQKIDELLNQELEKLRKTTLNVYPDGYPQCNCYELIQRRELKNPKEKWKNIADEFQIPYGTVTAHYDRKCKKLLKELSNLYKIKE